MRFMSAPSSLERGMYRALKENKRYDNVRDRICTVFEMFEMFEMFELWMCLKWVSRRFLASRQAANAPAIRAVL